MEFLKELLFGKRGILYHIESGREKKVVRAEKIMLLDAAKENKKLPRGNPEQRVTSDLY